MTSFGEHGQKIEKAEKEIDNLKATTERQGAEMKVMENKLDKYETIINEQVKKLNDKKRNIQDLERSLHNQDKEIDNIKGKIIIMKGNLPTARLLRTLK